MSQRDRGHAAVAHCHLPCAAASASASTAPSPQDPLLQVATAFSGLFSFLLGGSLQRGGDTLPFGSVTIEVYLADSKPVVSVSHWVYASFLAQELKSVMYHSNNLKTPVFRRTGWKPCVLGWDGCVLARGWAPR